MTSFFLLKLQKKSGKPSIP